MLEHPTLLLRRAQSNPDNVRVRDFDGKNDFAILLQRQWTKRRTVRSGNYGAGEPGKKSRSQVLRNTGRATVKKVPVTLRGSLLAERGHQFRSVDAAWHVESLPATDPHQRHPVRNDQIG